MELYLYVLLIQYYSITSLNSQAYHPGVSLRLLTLKNANRVKLHNHVLLKKLSFAHTHIHLMSEILNTPEIYLPNICVFRVLLLSSGVMHHRLQDTCLL